MYEVKNNLAAITDLLEEGTLFIQQPHVKNTKTLPVNQSVMPSYFSHFVLLLLGHLADC